MYALAPASGLGDTYGVPLSYQASHTQAEVDALAAKAKQCTDQFGHAWNGPQGICAFDPKEAALQVFMSPVKLIPGGEASIGTGGGWGFMALAPILAIGWLVAGYFVYKAVK